MSPAAFYEMRVGEFFEALMAYRREKEGDRMHAGELARGAALRLFNIQLKRGSQIKDPRDFWPMPWDEDKDEKEREVLKELNNLSDEERTAKANALLERIGWKRK